MSGHRWTPSSRDLGPGEVQTCTRCALQRRRVVIVRPRSVPRTAWEYTAPDVRGWHVVPLPPCEEPR